VALGSKAFFIGGGDGTNNWGTSTDIDIYDTSSGVWSHKTLSRRRTYTAAVTAGGKVLIGYGKTTNGHYPELLDIYDPVEGWSTVTIPFPRYGVGAAAVGSKSFWAGGGTDTDKSRVTQVDVYDTADGTWSQTHALSVGRWSPEGASVGSKILFAGGSVSSDASWGANAAEASITVGTVDIIDVVTDAKTTATLSIGRGRMAVATVGNLVIFAGGRVMVADGTRSETDRVDVYDASDGSWSTASLSSPRSSAAAVTAGHAVYVGGGLGGDGATLDVIDVFDAVSRRWSVFSSVLTRARALPVGVGLGGLVIFAGGIPSVTDTVNPHYNWREAVKTVDILSFDISKVCVSCEAGKYSPEGRGT